MSKLFSPFTMRELTLPNRIVISPMCQYSAEGGHATNWHVIHLGNMALSGAGMLCIEATAVAPEGRITPGCLGLWDFNTETSLRKLVRSVRRYSNIALAVQLAHAGRKGSSHVPWETGQQIPLDEGGWLTDAPSAVPHQDGELPPRALDDARLEYIRNAFAAAAERADQVGFDAIELHCAHGYLLHEFLSPLSNHREDQYGGSLENRMRFPLEVFEAVRAAFPAHKPVGVKVSATDWVDGGWGLQQTIVLARELKLRGADYICASSGGTSPLQKIPLGPGYQVPFAEAIRQEAEITTMAVGLITEPRQAEAILAEGRADLIAVARGMLYNPRWPWHAAAELGGSVAAPPQYWRSQPQGLRGLFGDTPIGQR